jgi:hypothetical protein
LLLDGNKELSVFLKIFNEKFTLKKWETQTDDGLNKIGVKLDKKNN